MLLRTHIRKYITPDNIFNFVMIILVLGLCILAGLKRLYFADFFPINGDFQNYNGFRRLIDGQIPFKDFYFYLGLGPLYSNSFLLVLIGDNFAKSLFVTNFTTALMFAVAVLVVFKLNRVKSSVALVCTFVITSFGLGMKDPFNFYIFFEKFNFLSYSLPGVSLRMQRAFLPFLVALCFLLLNKKRHKNKIYNLFFLGFLSGSCLVWANDYGISVCLAITYIFVLKKFQINLEFFKHFLIYILSIIVGVSVIVSLLTKGNLFNWLDYNFLGVASDQFWYYERSVSSKFLVLSDLPIDFEIVCGFFYILFLSYKVRRGAASRKEALLLLVILSTLVAGYAYTVSSLKWGQFIPFYMVFYISIFSIILNHIKNIFNINKKLLYFKFLVPIVILIILAPKVDASITQLYSDRGVYVEKLGGNLSRYGESLQLLSKYVVIDGEVFSTYSSALDVMSNKFQPSGIDYIIHALGNRYRERYLKSFHESAPKYITTIREDFTEWEYWVKRANWYFYRKFLGNYEPVAVTEYNVLWQKTNKDLTVDATIEDLNVVQINDSAVEIRIKTDPEITNTIADVTINYSSNWNKKRWKGFGIRKIVNVSDGWNNEGQGGYNIPEENKNYAIPIRIIDGEGFAKITSNPIDLTTLKVNHVTINQFYKDSIDYEDIENKMLKDNRLKNVYDKTTVRLSNFTDMNWEGGINLEDRSILLFENNLNNLLSLNNTKIIDINGTTYSVEKVDVKDSNWIHVYINQPLNDKVKYLKLM